MTSSHAAPKTDITRPGLLLRVEGSAALIAGLAIYAHLDVTWWLFAALFFGPDIAFLAIPLGKRISVFVYNTLHSYTLPALLAVVGLAIDENLLPAIAVIWAAHIGIDRLIGYGLKYVDREFNETHIQQV